jgi:hypothetical protein
MLEYRELRIRITKDAAGGYRTYAEGPSGIASGVFMPPFSDEELDGIVGEISDQVGRARKRRAETPDSALVKHFGGVLFDALFEDEIRDLYNGSLRAAADQGKGLRLTLALKDAPKLMLVPWEFLYDEPNFLAISDLTPIVRYLELKRARDPIEIVRPLRILAMVSSPTGVAELDVEREKENIDRALARLKADGAVDITWLEQATLDELQRCLLGGPYHVFHYIGHGEYDAEQEDGVLLLEDERGRPDPVSGVNLGATLANHTSLRLAALNSCEGGRTADDDPFAGVATSLVQSQIPAVIAMQFAITDRVASIFSKWLYESLAAGFPVDRALAQARLAIFNKRSGLEWGTPVLFMRVQDGRIFDVPAAPPVPPPLPPDDEQEEQEEQDDQEEPDELPWWRTRTTALLAAVVAAFLAAVAVAFGLRGGGGGPTPPDLWSAAPVAGMDKLLAVAAAGQDKAFAVGKARGSPVVQRYRNGHWSRETVPGSGAMRALAVSRGTAVAAGFVVERKGDVDAGIWRRTRDGSWLLACADQTCGDSAPQAVDGRQQVLDLTATSAGTFVAVGRETTREGSRHPAVWRSENGTNWSRVDGKLSGFSSGDFMTGVAAAGSRLVAVGSSGRDGAAWISDDGGSRWTKMTGDDLAARGRAVEPLAVTAAPSGFAAVGRERLERGSKIGPVAWFSGDGRSWNRASVQNAEFTGQQMAGVAATATGLVAVGADSGKNEAAVWQSADGREWSPVSSGSFSGGRFPAMEGLDALADGTVLSVGFAGGEGRAWTSKSS